MTVNILPSINPDVTVEHYYAVVHEYQVLLSINPDMWTEPERKYNNYHRSEHGPESAIKIYGKRLGEQHEYRYIRPHYGVYGYRWRDIGIVRITKTTTTFEEVIMEEEK